jgi:phage protein D
VRRAIESGTPLTQAQIDKITGRYKDRLLAYRGKQVSENETFRAQAASREEAMMQVMERPDVETVTRKWQLGFPKEHRENHVALAGQRIDWTERFDLGNGITARCPHDPDLPIGESAGCKCSCVYRVKLRRD